MAGAEHRIIAPYQRRPGHTAGQLRLYVRNGKPHYDLRLNVNPIAPGFTATPFTQSLTSGIFVFNNCPSRSATGASVICRIPDRRRAKRTARREQDNEDYLGAGPTPLQDL